MIPRRISGATNNLAAPEKWNDERDGKCGALWVRFSEVPGCLIRGRIESAWEPTPDELAMLQAGGSVILTVIGGQMPPVMLSVAAAEPEQEDGIG